MINTNSPIVQCLGNMPSQGMSPFTMGASNMIGIGSNGYNNANYGGYYNNNYNPMFNPYVYQKQIEMQAAMQREEDRKQSEMWKVVSRNTHKALGLEVTEEQLKVYDPVAPEVFDEGAIKTPFTVKIVRGEEVVHEVKEAGKGNPAPLYMQSRKTLQLIEIANRGQTADWLFDRIQYNINRVHTDNTSRCPIDMPFEEFLSHGGELYVDALVEKSRKQRLDRTQTYNGSDYNQLISMHKNFTNNPFFKGTFAPQQQRSIDVSDLEIKLPDHLKNSFTERKAQFLNTLLNR